MGTRGVVSEHCEDLDPARGLVAVNKQRQKKAPIHFCARLSTARYGYSSKAFRSYRRVCYIESAAVLFHAVIGGAWNCIKSSLAGFH